MAIDLGSGAVRRMLIGTIRNIFNDAERGETPVVRSDQALYPPDSVIWRVHGDVTSMMVGGVSALLLQMLHPSALAGVWDHSTFREDMLGRLRRTARFIAVTTYGERELAQAAIAKVRAVHEHVRGTLPDGTPYRATDPNLLAWVHVTEAVSFLDAWIRYGEPNMSAADQDRYFLEFADIARALDADPVPETRAEAEALIARYRPELVADDRTRAVADKVLHQPYPSLMMAPAQALIMRAAVDLLPDWAREMHRLGQARATAPLVRSATAGIAGTMRWAFGGGVK
ncbi:DUF2236 domain-containing protein, partial [Nostoc sp. 3335mG]